MFADPNEIILRTSTGARIYNAKIIRSISQYVLDPSGSSFSLPNGTSISVDLVQKWYENYEYLSSKFKNWCHQCALVADPNEIAAYFGNTACLIDVPKQIIIWPKFYHAMIDAVTSKINLVERFDYLLRFDEVSGLCNISTPFLFPSRHKLFLILGGLEKLNSDDITNSNISHAYRGKHVSHAKHDNHNNPANNDGFLFTSIHSDEAVAYQRLHTYWQYDNPCGNTDEHRGKAITSLISSVRIAYESGNYDADKIFEDFARNVDSWAAKYFIKDDILLHDRPAQIRVVRKLAASEMIRAESTMLDAVFAHTQLNTNSPPKLDDKRLDVLKQGTLFRPA